MAKYFIGELGYEADSEFDTITSAERAAMDSSVEKECTAISIWDSDDNVHSIALNGEIFIKREN